jgi:hypothetical protein
MVDAHEGGRMVTRGSVEIVFGSFLGGTGPAGHRFAEQDAHDFVDA